MSSERYGTAHFDGGTAYHDLTVCRLIEPGQIPVWPAQVGNEADFDRILPLGTIVRPLCLGRRRGQERRLFPSQVLRREQPVLDSRSRALPIHRQSPHGYGPSACLRAGRACETWCPPKLSCRPEGNSLGHCVQSCRRQDVCCSPRPIPDAPWASPEFEPKHLPIRGREAKKR